MWLLTVVVLSAVVTGSPLYTNQFAIRIKNGNPDELAAKHGFINVGQIGSLEDYYLFEHPKVKKRSVVKQVEHHENLRKEPQMRNPKRKTSHGTFTAASMKTAVQEVLEDDSSLRVVASTYDIAHQTLARYVKKQKQNPNDEVRMTPNYSVRKIFTSDQEKSLADYVIKCSKMFHGLSKDDVRKLAFQMATINRLKIPEQWKNTEKAGIDWAYGFMKRNPQLSLRTPEGCSLARAIAFNRHNAEMFYNLLEEVLVRGQGFLQGRRIYNLDETSTTTNAKTQQKVIAERGTKQVSSVTSGENGTLVTTCVIIAADGNCLPPRISQFVKG